jgi:SAM-dependent methyltransferase
MILYALTIVVSAFLLFQVQPVIAKIILPWFGGSAAVWTVCMLFFQMALLLGYLYAHALVRYLKPRTQMLVHAGLLLVSALALPVYPSASWKPMGGEEPTLRILGLLAATVGLPYFLLSTTGPLLQAWYARRFRGAMPYRLYALSNAGSMFALLSYPVLFEPRFTTHQQAWMWSAAYGVFVVLCGVTAIRSGNAAEEAVAVAGPEAVEKPSAKQYAMWLLLPAVASLLLLAITNHLSQNVAAIPFLWVLPLSIYLLTFILCFEGSGWYRRNPYLQLLAVALGSMAYALSVDSTGSVPIRVMVPLFAMGLFTCCMVCHGELARLKPDPRYLTHFYVMIAAGGALGGLLVGLLAPRLFNALYEMPLGLVACAVLVVAVLRAHPDPGWFGDLLPPARFGAGVLGLALAGFLGYRVRDVAISAAYRLARIVVKPGWTAPQWFESGALLAALAICVVLVVMVLRGRKAGQLAPVTVEILTLALTGFLAYQIGQSTSGCRALVRNFYGALKVRDNGPATQLDATRTLTHGTINHGEQFLNPARRDLPTTYYGPDTGVGQTIRERGKNRAIRVGVIGLGTGTLAAYGRPGDYYRFYEINPLVLRLAHTEFSFLGDSKAQVDVAMGDARLSLEREAPENFDVLAVDAFSSDSIPVHLLTLEAMLVYFRHLRPDGVLAVHISNRYLDLAPVLAGETRATGKIARVVDTDDDDTQDVFGATWVLITSPASGFHGEELKNSAEIESKRTVRLWTDDYSNLFRILK